MSRGESAGIGPAEQRTKLLELAGLFLKLGTIAFGGPAAHIALMEDEVVRRRGWLTQQEFLDMVGATNLIPGPNSTELAIHIGFHRARLPGLVIAGACFIVPAVIIVSTIAWAYVKYGQLPVSTAILYGVKPVIIAIVLQALWRLAGSAVKTTWLGVVGILAATAAFAGTNELLILAVAAALVAISRAIENRKSKSITLRSLFVPLPLAIGGSTTLASSTTTTAAAVVSPVGILPLFLVFLKIGSVLFGSGYVLLAFLRSDFVERLGWLTEAQIIDATAVGQVTPGPVFTTATFIGYVLAGPAGAVVATVGIFLPAFVFVALSAPLIPKMRDSQVAAGVLDGLNVASLALMAVVTWQLGRAAFVDVVTVSLAVVSAVLLLRYRLNATWLILGGAIVGLMAAFICGQKG